MDQFLRALNDLIQEHWMKMLLAGLFMGVGWFLGRQRAKREWQSKEFLGRLNISLNVIENNHLLIRTISESTCEEVFGNDVAVKRVLAAARETTEADPLLPLSEDDYWHYLNAVLNHISEMFAQGQIKKDLGQPVTCGKYLACLTCENVEPIRSRKVRAMLIRKEELRKLNPTPKPSTEETHASKLGADHTGALELVRPVHKTRLETLQKMAVAYDETRWKFIELEICV